MFGEYTKNEFERLNRQRNIFVLVGNGFDIALLNKYQEGKMAKKTTSYVDFYNYITYYSLTDERNMLYKRLTEKKNDNIQNWSDFELVIDELITEFVTDRNANKQNLEMLEKDVDRFQGLFTQFLNDIVDADVLLKVNSDVMSKELAMQSLSQFLLDLDHKSLWKLKFRANTSHYDLFDFVFANFNYTSLLDNYIYMDKFQFQPHGYRTVDTNFTFYVDDSDINPTVWSSYVLCDVVHPHGVQDIPRSMLFGIDSAEDKTLLPEKNMVKSYLAQYAKKYCDYLEKADLFIIYGMSFGKNDGWWMDNIFDRLLSETAELIIYRYGNETEEAVKELFIASCIRHESAPQEDIEKVKNNIYVVTFTENNTYFLGLENKNSTFA